MFYKKRESSLKLLQKEFCKTILSCQNDAMLSQK